jgi:hypothetical protein
MIARASYRTPSTGPYDHAHDDDATHAPAPPPDSHIPAVPPGFVPTLGSDFKGVPPRAGHMAALPDVIEELLRFDDFAEVFGKTAPPYELTLEIVRVAYAWSRQRAEMRAWDLYCRTQEGLAWRELRGVMSRLAPAYHLAVATDSTLASRFPGFERLLTASRLIGQKGAETRRANARLKAEGKAPFKGRAGERRRRAAQKALAARASPTDPTP